MTTNILQVSTTDLAGGAERIAWNLFLAYRARGYGSWLAVGNKQSSDVAVLPIPHDELRGKWIQFWNELAMHLRSHDGRVRGAWRAAQALRALAEPGRWFDAQRGREDFRFPGTWRLLQLTGRKPDILHLHNLHGSYFDLKALPWLSRRVPVIVTLHDAWLMSGHCAHSFECERWKTGCGNCPDLSIYPAIKRDATRYNWQRKRDIYFQSRFHVVTPSRWLMAKVKDSILAPSIVSSRVIPNGVDLSVFRQGDKQGVRGLLGFSPNVKLVLFAANGIRRNVYKDYTMMHASMAQLACSSSGRRLLFVALGEDAPVEHIGDVEVRSIAYESDPAAVARYYQAADVYIHAARAEAWGLTVTEALACGTPVVATAVGGITEQVKGLDLANGALRRWNGKKFNKDQATGILVAPGDTDAMARAIERLLDDDPLRHQLGNNATQDARRFGVDKQVESYLEWYEELLKSPMPHDVTSARAASGD